jgi:UDP-N-acetylmuramyl pentapeptide phosphotransferase/UDP-N-acetylglucosamine-1-phosphate transferase
MSDGIDGLTSTLTLMALALLVMAMHLIGRPLDVGVPVEIIIFRVAIFGFFILNLGLVKNRKIFSAI